MKKNVLSFEPQFSFRALAVISTARAYRLCWLFQQNLSIKFQRVDDLILFSKQKNQTCFQVFEGADPDLYCTYVLLGNKTEGGILVPEQKTVDYYLKIDGDTEPEDINRIMTDLKKLSAVQHVFEVDINSLKSKHNLLF